MHRTVQKQQKMSKNKIKNKPNFNPDQLQSQNDNTFYQVDKIIAKRVNQYGKQEYRIRWANYGEQFDTWEPRENLKQAKDCFEDFEQQINNCMISEKIRPGNQSQINDFKGFCWENKRQINIGEINLCVNGKLINGKNDQTFQMMSQSYAESKRFIIKLQLQNIVPTQTKNNYRSSQPVQYKNNQMRNKQKNKTIKKLKVDKKLNKSQTYQVDSIVGKIMAPNACQFLYRVRWTGYPPEQDTWQPLEHLKDVMHLVEKYDKSIGKTKKIKKQTVRPNQKQLKKPKEKQISMPFKNKQKQSFMKKQRQNKIQRIKRSKKFYQVQKIVGKRRTQSGLQYRVHWKGFSSSSDTWQPAKNLQKVQCLIQKFQNEQKLGNTQNSTQIKPNQPAIVTTQLNHPKQPHFSNSDQNQSQKDDYELCGINPQYEQMLQQYIRSRDHSNSQINNINPSTTTPNTNPTQTNLPQTLPLQLQYQQNMQQLNQIIPLQYNQMLLRQSYNQNSQDPQFSHRGSPQQFQFTNQNQYLS